MTSAGSGTQCDPRPQVTLRTRAVREGAVYPAAHNYRLRVLCVSVVQQRTVDKAVTHRPRQALRAAPAGRSAQHCNGLSSFMTWI